MTSTESCNLLVKVKKIFQLNTHTHDYLIKYKEINRAVVKLRLQSVKGARVGVTYIRIIHTVNESIEITTRCCIRRKANAAGVGGIFLSFRQGCCYQSISDYRISLSDVCS